MIDRRKPRLLSVDEGTVKRECGTLRLFRNNKGSLPGNVRTCPHRSLPLCDWSMQENQEQQCRKSVQKIWKPPSNSHDFYTAELAARTKHPDPHLHTHVNSEYVLNIIRVACGLRSASRDVAELYNTLGQSGNVQQALKIQTGNRVTRRLASDTSERERTGSGMRGGDREMQT